MTEPSASLRAPSDAETEARSDEPTRTARGGRWWAVRLSIGALWVLAVVAAFPLDNRVEAFAASIRSTGWIEVAYAAIKAISGTWVHLLFALAVLLLLLAASWRRAVAFFAALMASWAPAIGTVELVKALTARPRPYLVGRDPATLTQENYSFPSGHAMEAFLFATVIGAFVPRLRIPLYVLAVLIALGRVYASAHYTSDILAGAGVGLLSGLTIAPWVSRRFARRQPREAAQPHDPAARKAHQSDERAAAGD